MLFRIVRPLRRKTSRHPYFVQRVPADVRKRLATVVRLTVPLGAELHELTIRPGQADVRVSLRTSDPIEAKARHGALSGHFARVWQALREQSPIPLSHEQAVALSREPYLAEFRNAASEPFLEPEEWEALVLDIDDLEARPDADLLEERLGALADRVLSSKGILRVDADSRRMLLREFCRSLKQAFEQRQRHSEGDYSPDPKAGRFPEWQPAPQPQQRTTNSPNRSLQRLVKDWWIEKSRVGLKPSTRESYERTFRVFAEFLGHDDASRVSRQDVFRFKDARLAATDLRSGKPISPRTVKDTDLAALKAVFRWAVENGRADTNPAEGVTIRGIKRSKVRRGFNDQEAAALLKAAHKVSSGHERKSTRAAKRWVPWVLAYTGARVGEIAQLRKQDVTHEGKHWIITISPDAGTVKTNEARRVPVHPHLIELGFIEFVKAAPQGHLFLRVRVGGPVLGPLQALKNRLAEFAREVVRASDVPPTQGWRHRFKSVCREVGIDPETRDVLQGHAPRSVGERYGETSIEVLARAIEKLPRYPTP